MYARNKKNTVSEMKKTFNGLSVDNGFFSNVNAKRKNNKQNRTSKNRDTVSKSVNYV